MGFFSRAQGHNAVAIGVGGWQATGNRQQAMGNRQQAAGVGAVVVICVYKTKSAVILTRKRQKNTYGLGGIAPLSPLLLLLLLLLGSIAVRDRPQATGDGCWRGGGWCCDTATVPPLVLVGGRQRAMGSGRRATVLPLVLAGSRQQATGDG